MCNSSSIYSNFYIYNILVTLSGSKKCIIYLMSFQDGFDFDFVLNSFSDVPCVRQTIKGIIGRFFCIAVATKGILVYKSDQLIATPNYL